MSGMQMEIIGHLSYRKAYHLGTGKYGKVFHGQYKNAIPVAIKRMEKGRMKVDSIIYNIANGHPNIIHYFYTNEDADFEFL